MNKTFKVVRSLVWEKPKTLLERFDISSFFCEETCRACGRSVSDVDPEYELNRNLEREFAPVSSRELKLEFEPKSDREQELNTRLRARRYCLCYKCSDKLLSNRQSLWWLPIPGTLGTDTAVTIRRTLSTTFDTTTFLPVVTASMYEGVMQKLIRKLKYDDDRLVVRDISVLMQRAFLKLQTEVEAFQDLDNLLIVPIPLHRSREQKRGYNQAHLLAKDLALKNKLRISCNSLRRVKKTKPQFGLNKQDRLANIENAFALGTADIEGKAIILVDDVFTSGATLTLCAKLLTTGGASRVAAIAAARAPYDR